LITLITLVVEAIAIALANVIDNPIFWWAPFVVLAIALISIMVLTIVRPEFLTKGASSLTIRFNFDNAKDVRLLRNKCFYEIFDSNGNEKGRKTFIPINGKGGWYFVLPSKVMPSDSIYFKLFDANDNEWEISDFRLCDYDKEPIRL